MATVALGILCAWPSTHASIPAGWSEDTSYASAYIQGAPASGDADFTARGNSTHTHTVTDHTHTQNTHTHTFSGSAITSSATADNSVGDGNASLNHAHASKTGAATAAVNQNATVTLDGTSNDPPFFTVIWIKSDGSPTGIPVNAYAFFSSDTLPSGWTRVQGNKFLKGAAAAGDGGATGGSSDAHTHTNTAHNHTQNSHTHASTVSTAATATGSSFSLGGGTDGVALVKHTHTVTMDAATATNQTASVTMSNGDAQPVFKKLNIINNGNGAADLPTNLICIWGGTNAGIPASWTRFTAMDGNFLKGANADGESGTTGGVQTHGHTANAHTHTQNSHNNHGTTQGAASLKAQSVWNSPDFTVDPSPHTHTWTIGTTTATNQNTTVSIASNSSESAYPAYVRPIFIQFQGVVAATPLRTLLGVGI